MKQDTIISEKIEVEVKQGDTLDTAKIVNKVTKEVSDFTGTIGDLKKDISNLEKEIAGLQLTIDGLNSEIAYKQGLITKYEPEVKDKLNSPAEKVIA